MNKSPYILALALSQTAFPATLAVDARNTSATHNGTSRYPYATIQAAIAAAAPKDTVKVAGGVYDSVHIEKSLVLLGGYPGAKSADYQAGTDGDFSTRGKAADSSVLKGTKKAAVMIRMLRLGPSVTD